MQTKYKLPKDVYQAVIWIIRGQSRRAQEYKEKRDDILSGGGAKYIEYKDKPSGETARAYMPSTHSNLSETETKALALYALENESDTLIMKAIANAMQKVLNEELSFIPSAHCREALSEALYMNIENRKENPYRNLYNVCICEKTFYKLKSKFIYYVAKELELF